MCRVWLGETEIGEEGSCLVESGSKGMLVEDSEWEGLHMIVIGITIGMCEVRRRQKGRQTQCRLSLKCKW